MPAPVSYPASNGQPEPEFVRQMEYFCQMDAKRHELFCALYEENLRLRGELNDKTTDYDNEVQSRRSWQERVKSLEMQFKSMEMQLHAASSISNAKPFVLALIDGDGVLFNDELIQAGKDGGSMAASLLYDEIKHYIATASVFENSGGYDVVANIYINFVGLAYKLTSCGIIESPEHFRIWINAFSINQPLFNIIDVGDGKERADHKLKETFRLFIENNQCKHIIFGGCHDAGYLTFLDTYKLTEYRSKITLLRSVAEAHILNQFKALGFRLANFTSIFRTTGLPDKPKAVTPPQIQTSLARPPNGSGSSSGPSPSVPNWAAVSGGAEVEGKVLPVGSPQPIPAKVATATAAMASSTRKIFRNAEGLRVDIPLPKAERSAISSLNSRIARGGNLCNEYHLTGKCPVGPRCDYRHDPRLSVAEQLALRHKARSRLCKNESDCNNAHCFFGHMCANTDCWYENCNFARLHNINKIPKTSIDENGEVEILTI